MLDMSSRWELGSEFHWHGCLTAPLDPWPEPAVWYLLGRHALMALVKHLPRSRRVWLPNYFCQEVTRAWSAHAEIRLYEDSPQRVVPVWETLKPSSDDMVVAVNYFGIRQGDEWAAWRSNTPCVLVEDHSHDPQSSWAKTSTADYAFSSLRKSYPVPDGCLLWSPRGRSLPPRLDSGFQSASMYKLVAMILKEQYLYGSADKCLKERYRNLQLMGEELLTAYPVSGVSFMTEEYLRAGVPRAWRF